MSKDGTLSLSDKPWWADARALAVGKHKMLRSALPGGGRMLVRREKSSTKPKAPERLVWVIDDDGDMPAGAADGDTDSDCYVVDYGADGTVDRMVDYLDNDGDDDPDEMEIRYFHKGQLHAVRQGRWKLRLANDRKIVNLGNTRKPFKAELYDLRADIGETNNLAAQHPDVVQRLTKLAGQARVELGDDNQKGTGQRPAKFVENPQPQVKGKFGKTPAEKQKPNADQSSPSRTSLP